MKQLLFLLFIPSFLFSQEITVNSVNDESLLISDNTINFLSQNGYDSSLFNSFSQAVYVDFNKDNFLDLICFIQGNPSQPAVLSVFLWNNDSAKFIEDNNYLMVVEGEAALWDDTVGDFNGDGLNDIYVPVQNYHGQSGQQPEYYPPFQDSSNMPGHLFLNNGNGFDSQYIDDAIFDGYGYPNYERGFVLDVDNDDIPDIIVPSVNQHPENTPSNNFLVTKYNVNTNNEVTYNFIYQWENSFNVPDFFITSQSVVVREYDNKIYVLYPGYEQPATNGQYSYPEVSIYSKETDANGDFILLDKFRLQRGNEIENQNNYVNRDTFYIRDLDNDGNEEFIMQMYTLNATPHGGLHVFNHLGTEVTETWFKEDEYLGNSANGFYVDDYNNDGLEDILMVDVYTDNHNETVFYFNRGNEFVQKTIELEGSGWVFPVDTNKDGIFEIFKFNTQPTNSAEISYDVYLNNLDYSNVLGVNDFKNNIKIYPSPASDFVYVKSNKKLEIIIFDILGKEINRLLFQDKVDVSYLNKGIYFLKILDGANSSTYKIIKE